MDDYELLDFGDGARLERFGERIADRPHGGALGARRTPERWAEADLRFDRDRGWTTTPPPIASAPWTITMAGLTLILRPTDAGQVGLFPEHAALLPWLEERVTSRLKAGTDAPPTVLHLFAHTGLATLALARAGASITHVDASRPAVRWARDNAASSGLEDRPIRWLVDDAPALVAREIRRGRTYDGIVLDPPSYGHGGKGSRRWGIRDDLPPLLDGCRRLLADDGFILLTAHSDDLGADRLHDALIHAWGPAAATAESGGSDITAATGAILSLGAYVRLDLDAT
ncbi:MAG: hypothetical protein WEC14_04670 [Chloroflexota bacterium]